MSGGNCPETPRQKMIGMMYLMLTAMLALNVSGDLLNAYLLVDKSIKDAKAAIESKNALMYTQFENAFQTNPAKVEKSWTDAQEIRKKADELVEHIQDLKLLFVKTVDGEKAVAEGIATPDKYQNVGDQDKAAQLMITENFGKRSKELKEKIAEYRDFLISHVDKNDTALIKTIEEGLTTEADTRSRQGKSDDHKTWEGEKFEHIPMAASMALMSQIQSTTRNLESDVVRYLFAKLDEESYKFNKVDPLVIQKSEYILAGDEYYARIMIAARDTTQPPVINIPGKSVTVDPSGVGIMRFPATTTGTFNWKGEISIKSPDGKEDRIWPIEASYTVAQPNVVISAIKMNVFYEGIENPIDISVPGIANDLLSVDITNATFVKKGSQYMVTPRTGTAGGKATVSVNAKINNSVKNMGKGDFRIKRVPPPIAKVNKQTEGKIAKSLLMAQMGVDADMEDFDFEGIKWKVNSFKVSVVKGGYITDEPSSSSLFTKAQKDLINGMSRGQRVVIEDIKAEGPGGAKRNLNSIVLLLD